jgi:hypothetical protein
VYGVRQGVVLCLNCRREIVICERRCRSFSTLGTGRNSFEDDERASFPASLGSMKACVWGFSSLGPAPSTAFLLKEGDSLRAVCAPHVLEVSSPVPSNPGSHDRWRILDRNVLQVMSTLNGDGCECPAHPTRPSLQVI